MNKSLLQIGQANTPLHQMAIIGDLALATPEIQLKYGDIQDSLGATYLHYLASNGHLNKTIPQAQEKFGAIQDVTGATYLHDAAKSGHLYVSEELQLKFGHIKDENNNTYIHCAAESNNLHQVSQKAQLLFGELINKDGDTYLHKLFQSPNPESELIKEDLTPSIKNIPIDVILRIGAVKNLKENTFLHNAVISNHITEIPLRAIIIYGNIQNNLGQTVNELYQSLYHKPLTIALPITLRNAKESLITAITPIIQNVYKEVVITLNITEDKAAPQYINFDPHKLRLEKLLEAVQDYNTIINLKPTGIEI